MHELSIAEGLIEQVLEIAQKNQLSGINEVVLKTGEIRQIIPDVMQEAFKAVSLGTIAETAILTIEEIKTEAKCNICSQIFHPEIDDYLCPICNKADISILKGEDIILASVVGDTNS